MEKILTKNSFFNVNCAFLAMITIVATSNYLVLFPINDWLTWGALPYPMCFLVTELTNRTYGPVIARRIVYAGFIVAALLSIWLATPRIAFASGTAFLISQLLDIYVFNKFRQAPWWYGPFFASFAASIVDGIIFWSLAFLGEDLPILTWMLGDTAVKLVLDVAMLTPFRLAISKLPLASRG